MYKRQFGISAAVAMVMAFFGAPLILDWVVFVGLGAVLFSVFWKKSRKSMAAMESPPGAGHDRLIGALGQALEDIPDGPSSSGLVKTGGEEWRAISDSGPILSGSVIEIIEVRGTRVVVQMASVKD